MGVAAARSPATKRKAARDWSLMSSTIVALFLLSVFVCLRYNGLAVLDLRFCGFRFEVATIEAECEWEVKGRKERG